MSVTRRRRKVRRHAALRRAADTAARRYRKYPNVVGVSAGTKYEKGRPLDQMCVQFFVTRKTGAASPALPSYICGRRPDGTVDRTQRFPTDVIAVGRPQLACGAGAAVEGIGRSGTIALLFRNKADRDRDSFYLLTCAHLAGDLGNSPPADAWLESAACSPVTPFAEVIKNGTRRRESLEYDLALARVTDSARESAGEEMLDRLDGRIAEHDVVLRQFIEAEEIRPPLSVECQLAESGACSGRIRSYPGTVLIRVEGRDTWVRNAYLIDVPVRSGDSGGIVYANELAVGMIFARSPRGMGWFHPLEPALRHLESLAPAFAVQCFS